MQEAVPRLSLFEFEGSITVSLPLVEQRNATILVPEVGSQRIFKAAAKGHCRTRFLFPPAIQVAIAVASRTAKILANLRKAVAIAHRNLPVLSAHRRHRLTPTTELPIRWRARRNLGSDRK